ncbi:putative nuclease HARBI1 isoform X1, partial [Tanacetum coccineum]
MDSNHENTNVNRTSKKAASRKTVWDTSTHITFVELCLEEVRNGNRPGTHFNKIGWTNLEKNLKARSGKVFNKQQLKNHWDTMKKDFKLYDRLMRIESGLGWDPVKKTIDATPEWWDEKIEADPDLAKFRDKNLEMYHMYYEQLFRDFVAVGDKTQLPIQFQNNDSPSNNQNNDSPSNNQEEEVGTKNIEGNGDSGEFNLGDGVEISFPESSSTKKKKKKDNDSNTRSKKGKTTGVSSSFELKLDTVLQTLTSRSSQTFPPQNHVPSIAECMDIVATFPGFEPSSTDYNKALRIFWKKEARESFMMDSDSDDENNDSNEEDWMEDENTWLLLCGLVAKGIIIGHNALNKKRLACRTSCRTGNILIQEILNGHPRRCYEDFRLHLDVFKDLCSDLKEHYGLKATRNVSIEESLGIFLMILAHGCGNRLAQETFNHSGETIHRHFHKVLKAVLKLSGDIIKPNTNYNEEVPPQILNNSRYYPMFKNCIGAIDGTHVRASVREHEQAKYIGRKGYATQNIMAACDFNMCFTFAWAGWEGTAHDTRIFYEALRRPEVNFPRPTGDKYYVVDAGYPNTKGYLAPYKGNDIRYHIPDFRRGQSCAQRAPKGKKETFNYYHSSLRNVIERTFGVWKARWAILKDMHVNYSYETQVSIVIASMAIHNYIRKKGQFDDAFNTAQQETYNPGQDFDNE